MHYSPTYSASVTSSPASGHTTVKPARFAKRSYNPAWFCSEAVLSSPNRSGSWFTVLIYRLDSDATAISIFRLRNWVTWIRSFSPRRGRMPNEPTIAAKPGSRSCPPTRIRRYSGMRSDAALSPRKSSGNSGPPLPSSWGRRFPCPSPSRTPYKSVRRRIFASSL